MGSKAGQMWLWCVDGEKPVWADLTGLPVLAERGVAGPLDCVMHIGRHSIRRVSGVSNGGVRGDGISPLRLNAGARSFRELRAVEIERRLRREGLAARLDEASTRADHAAKPPYMQSRRYSATVFDLETVDIRTVSRFGPSGREPGGAARRILAKAAARAIYVLGLDFGQVELEWSDKGRAVIVSASADLRLQTAESEKNVAASIRQFAADWKKEAAGGFAVKLGADPEFVLLSEEGRIVPASRFFSPDGAAGCDSVVVRGVRRWPLAELRPEPADEPEALAADVRRLLAVAAKMTAGAPLAWLAGASPVRGLPLGGHIHLSGAALTGERLRALDNAVALPLRLLEPASASSRRPRYGSLGDFRRQPHGGFEYRTPPSWLVSRLLARGALALAKVAAEHARELASCRTLDDDTVRDAFYDGDRTVLIQASERVYAGIAATSGYRKYANLIDPLFEAIRDGKTWSESADFRRKWGIASSQCSD